MHTVRGWSNSSESGIYSNEVQYIGQEELNVRSFKGGEIACGLWKDIKNKVGVSIIGNTESSSQFRDWSQYKTR